MADSLPILRRFSETVPLHLSTPSSTLCPQRPQHLIKHQEHILHAFSAFCLPEIPPELTPWCVDMSPSGEIPTLGEKSLASQHPTDHPLPPATPAPDKTSRTCSPWILYTPLARDSPRTHSLVYRYVPLRQDSHIGGNFHCISAPHGPLFAPSDPSTEYNINNMFSMNSVYSVGQR